VIYEATDDHTPVESLIWSYNSNASWLSFNKLTRVLSGNPILSDKGWYWVNITVNDGEGGFDSHNFTINVYLTTNLPPEITTEDEIFALIDTLYSIDYEATDDRTPVDYLQWSLETNASWLNITNDKGVLSGTPTIKDLGWYMVSIFVTDGEGGWDYHDFILTVVKEPTEINNAPVLTAPTLTPIEGDTKTDFIFSVHYFDKDDDVPESIKVVIDGNEHFMTLKMGGNAANDIYECRIKLSKGNHTYYFTASDGIEIVNTNTYKTPFIKKINEGQENNSMLYTGIGIIIIIIVVLILLFIFLKKKKEKEEEALVEEEQPPPLEEVLPEVTAELPLPPEIPPEQPSVPETPPEQSPTPEVTPQVVPQIEAAPESAPQVEEQHAPTPQVEPPLQPQVAEQKPQGQVPVPKIKRQPTIKESNP
jgi:hypothetical protein